MRAVFLLISAAWVLMGCVAQAQILAPGGRTLWNRGLMVRSLVRFDARGGDRSFTQVNALVWGAAPRTAVSFVVPLVALDTAAGTTRGSGDATIFARYDVWRRNRPGGSTAFAVEGGLRLPTGSLGSGDGGAIGTLIFSRVRDPDWWLLDAQLEISSRGDALRPGKRWSYDAAYLRRLLPRARMGVPMLLGVVELNGASQEVARRHGAAVPATGGRTLHLSPGLELVVSKRLVLELAVPVLLDGDLDARPGSPSKSLVFGVRWLL